jgi:hypothetical protein
MDIALKFSEPMITVQQSTFATAKLTGVPGATGTVAFGVFVNRDCSGPSLWTGSAPVASDAARSDAVPFEVAGTFFWLASYRGDERHMPAQICESFVVQKARPSAWIVPTTQFAQAAIPLAARAGLTGATSDAAGTFSSAVYSDTDCRRQVAAPGETRVDGNDIQDSRTYTLSEGTYYLRGTYSGDVNNAATSTPCVAFTVYAAPIRIPTIALPPAPGPTALCRDGTYSYSANHSGTCSWHGGVSVWYR